MSCAWRQVDVRVDTTSVCSNRASIVGQESWLLKLANHWVATTEWLKVKFEAPVHRRWGDTYLEYIHSVQCALYRISYIRCHGYYFFAASFGVATTWGQIGDYFFGKPADFNDGWIRYVQAIQWRPLDADSSKCSHSVLLSAMETSRTTRTQQPYHCYAIQYSVHVPPIATTVKNKNNNYTKK